MEQITVNGFTFVLSPSNRVIVKGGGIKGSGIDLGSINNFSENSFLGGIKGVPAAADVQDQLQATASNIPEVIAALQQKPQEETTPPGSLTGLGSVAGGVVSSFGFCCKAAITSGIFDAVACN